LMAVITYFVSKKIIDIFGQNIISYFSLILLVSGALFTLLSFYLIKKIIINRLEKINNIITTIGSKKDFTLKVPEQSHDEISLISKKINNMVETIDEVEKLLSNIFNSMSSLIILTDNHFNITNLNHLAEKFICLSSDEARGRALFELFPFLKQFEEKFSTCINNQVIQEVKKIDFNHADEIRYFHIIAYTFRRNDRTIFVLRIDDISEKVKFQERIEMSDQLASIGTLASGVNYEIEQPILSMLSNLTPLQKNIDTIYLILNEYLKINIKENMDGKISEIKIKEERTQPLNTFNIVLSQLDLIKQNTMEILEIVKNLKITVRQDEDVMKQTNLHQGLDAILNLLHYYYQNRIQIIKEYGKIPDIEAFPGRINQVLISIISYAIDRIPAKGEIRIKTESTFKDVKIIISDNGFTIKDTEINDILESSSRSDEISGGLSVGLSFASSIIHDHGGSIVIRSSKEKGTTFILTLPISHEEKTIRRSRNSITID
ncbi:MAG TPA: ATP-binding protein, partial [Gammaproteobacteria bacterium]|nr:ATP-binding protein [Gammaproteobacteria bacterium]